MTNEYDFRDSITRVEFEALCAGLLDRIAAPISGALAMAGVSASELSFVEIAGGGIRIPRVQTIIKEVLGRAELDRHINGDEGAVQGAAFYAALQSPLFRVKDFRIKDLTTYPVALKLYDGVEEKQTSLFPEKSRLGSKKSISFSTEHNFTMKVSYDENAVLPAGSEREIAFHLVSGIPTTALYNFTGKPKVQCSYRLIDGAVVLSECDAEVNVTSLREIKPPKPKPTKKAKKPTKKKRVEEEEDEEEEEEQRVEEEKNAEEKTTEEVKEETNTEENVEEEVGGEEEAKVETETEESVEGSEAQEETEKPAEAEGDADKEDAEVPVVVVEKKYEEIQTLKRLRLKVETDWLGVAPLNKTSLAQVRARLSAIRRKEEEKKETERERNNIESFVYATRDKLDKPGV